MRDDNMHPAAQAVLSGSASAYPAKTEADRRFMVYERARRVGSVDTDHLDLLTTDEAEFHINFLESFSVISKELIK